MPRILTVLRRAATQKALHGALRLGRWLGPEGSMKFGELAGRLCGMPGPLRHRLAGNYRAVGIQPTKEVLDRYFQRLGLWIGWSLAVYEFGLEGSGIAARIEGAPSSAHFFEAAKKGRGVVLAEPHFFAHEIVAACANQRHPVAALVRENKSAAHNVVKHRWYDALGIKVVHRARHSSMLADTVALVRVLRSGNGLGITPDLIVPQSKGLPVRMFGRTVHLPAGFAFLAMRTGAPVVTSHLEWIGAESPLTARALVHCRAPITIPDGGDRNATLRDALQQWCDVQEAALRENPENWLFWLDKNWTRVLQQPRAA